MQEGSIVIQGSHVIFNAKNEIPVVIKTSLESKIHFAVLFSFHQYNTAIRKSNDIIFHKYLATYNFEAGFYII